MNFEEIAKEIKKLKYQVRTLAYTVDYARFPVESLILEMDWDENQINFAHDIFEKYDRKLDAGEDVKWIEFEMELKDKFNIGYQTVKSIVLAFYQNNQWVNVCKGYAFSFEPTTPIEFHRITRGFE